MHLVQACRLAFFSHLFPLLIASPRISGASSVSLPSFITTLLGAVQPSSSLGSLVTLLSEIQQSGRPSFLMTEVDMAALGGAEHGELGPSQGKAFDDEVAEKNMLDRIWEAL